MSDQVLVTEIPSSLKQLARIVVRGFYTIEDALIVDMLVRNPCKCFQGKILFPIRVPFILTLEIDRLLLLTN